MRRTNCRESFLIKGLEKHMAGPKQLSGSGGCGIADYEAGIQM